MRIIRLGALICVQILAALCIVELLGQTFFHNPYSFSAHRYLFTSPDSFRDIGSFWTYRPNANIKEVAIYQTARGGFEQEYACDYWTDRLGFVDNDNSDNRDYDFLLLGDSFTQGQGGCPWADRLRQDLPGASIYDAGLQGTGPGSWALIAQYLLQQGLHLHTVIVIFIADDFRRSGGIYPKAQLDCLHDMLLCHGQFFYPITPGLDLMQASARRARGAMTLYQRGLYFCEEHLWVTCFLASGIKHLVQPPQLPPPISEEARGGLHWLIANFPRLLFVRVRTKDELALKSDDAAILAVSRYLRDQKIDWTDCDIGYDGFLRRDGHPNSEGYARLAACIAGIVGRPETHFAPGSTLHGRAIGVSKPPSVPDARLPESSDRGIAGARAGVSLPK